VLGIPEADLPTLEETVAIFKALNRVVSLGEYKRLERAATSGLEYFSTLALQRRAKPGNDGISRMIAAENHGERLADEEIAPLCLALYLAGVETTSTLIGSAIRTLTDFPATAEALRAEPALMKPAMDEFLRYESPVQNVSRLAGTPRELAGQSIASGERVVVLLAAANRDGRMWHNPERFDFRRNGLPHVAFGDGSHACVGGALARMESQAALAAWMRMPSCRRVTQQDRWWDLDWLRRLREFPVEFC
jgi:cytochrome P450